MLELKLRKEKKRVTLGFQGRMAANGHVQGQEPLTIHRAQA